MKRYFAALFFAAGMWLAAAHAADEGISMNFSNADITMVVKYISEMTGKNFIVDAKVQGKVTILSPRKVSREEAYKVFESILEVYGYAAVPSGGVIKIVPIAQARLMGGTGARGGALSAEMRDSMITQLIPLKYVGADNMVNALRPLIPPTSYIAAYAQSNTLIIVDMESNLKRLGDIVERLDVEGREAAMTVLPLKYASAKDIAAKINNLLGKGQPGVPVPAGQEPQTIIADERLNALIVLGNEFFAGKVKRLTAQLDVESPPGRHEVNVIYLNNASAEDLAKVVNQILQSEKKAAPPPGQPPGQETVFVTPDKATNALIITGSPEQFLSVKRVIDRLDIPRKQVFVEALIFEVQADKASKFGVEWRTTSDFNKSGVQGIGGTNFGNINGVAQNPVTGMAGQGLVVGVVDGVVNFGGQTYANVGALVHALRTDTDVNILSTPNILTTDNEEAEIFVGSNVPFVKSTAQTTGATPIENIERQDIGITLKVKPQISESDFVKLHIFQEISSIAPTQLDKAKDIITFKRNAKTVVVVHDQQNVVIGGLMQENIQDVENKVPLLGDIPLLGWLFKSKSKQRTKTNLMIFLTPHIIKTVAEMERITTTRQKRMESTESPLLEEKRELDKMRNEINTVPAPVETPPAPDTEAPRTELLPRAPEPAASNNVTPAAEQTLFSPLKATHTNVKRF
ncbi:MAG: type II secretion system secretin GspD [Nitrospinae bacterium]|nr:type II secretion system secretin GspD [Nitrospinota bacterium]